MATRQLLAELTDAYAQRSGQPVAITSVGGVDAAKRVQAGETFDVVVLAADAIDKLIGAGRVQSGSKVDLVRSGATLQTSASTMPRRWVHESSPSRFLMYASTSVFVHQ